MRENIIIVGDSGFSRSIRWLIEDIDDHAQNTVYCVVGHVVSDVEYLGQGHHGLLGTFKYLYMHTELWDSLAMGVGAPGARMELSNRLLNAFPARIWPSLVSPRAHVSDRVHIQQGVIIQSGCRGFVDASVLEFALLNLNVTVGHDALIGRYCNISPSVNISGGCVIDEGAMIGTGAQILENLTVGLKWGRER